MSHIVYLFFLVFPSFYLTSLLTFACSYLIIIQNIFALLSPVYEEDLTSPRAQGLLSLVSLTSACLGLGLATLGLGVYCALLAGARADQPSLLVPALLYTPILVLKDKASNKGSRRFHNHGEGPWLKAPLFKNLC